MPVAGPPTPKFPARSSRPETENKGLAGSRARTVSAAEPPPLEFPAQGSRPKTETGETSANHAGRRASNPGIPGPRFAPENRNRGDEREPCRSPGLQPRNSRPGVRARKPKPERRARTMPATGPALFPSGPSHFPRPNPKTPGGSPAFFLILLSSYLLILLSDYLFQRTQVDSLESFQVRFQQRKHFLNSPFVGSFHVQRKHRIVQGLPQEEPTGVAI